MDISEKVLRKHLDLDSKALNVVLILVALGAVVFVVAVAPALPVALKILGIIDSPKSKRRLSKSYYYAKEKGYITEEKTKIGTKAKLTKKGIRKIRTIILDEIDVNRPSRWDKKWRIVMFDIPIRFKKGREGLRMKMKEWGFHQMQKSVWVYPYPCFDEVEDVAEFFGIKDHLVLLETKNVNREDELRTHFDV